MVKIKTIEVLATRFRELYSVAPEFIVRAPGRVNLIGEHTDYNEGFVFPAAIEYYVNIAGSARNDRQVRAYSVTFNQSTTFSLDDIQPSSDAKWSNYIRGVARILIDEGFDLRGANLMVEGTVPIGAGLSSSAAMEISACLSFETCGVFGLNGVSRAKIALRAEREFVGLQCGIMDQFISSLGQRDRALFLDTRTLNAQWVPLPASGISMVISNTNKPRGLVDSEYNVRRTQCEEAVRLLLSRLPDITALRDVSVEDLEHNRGAMPEPIFRRAMHVVTENARVEQSVTALKAGDIAQFGRLMNESHESLRDDYAVSCKELDVLVDRARAVEGVFGSRMTGAGFGGCTISLVADQSIERFKASVGAAYAAATGLRAEFYVCRAADGAQRLL